MIPRSASRAPICATAFAALSLFTAVPHARAQARPNVDAELARLDSLLDAGRIEQARQAIDRWNSAHPRSDTTVGAAARTHALMIQARAAKSWTDAEAALVAVAIGYPVSAHAPTALLRLGQGLLLKARLPAAGNDASRAAAYLERLIKDYPTSPLRAEAWIWLARAYVQAGQHSTACARLADARRMRLDSAQLQRLDLEQQHCNTQRR